MKFLKRIKSTYLALLPILAIVLFLHLFFYRFDTGTLLKFLVAIAIAGVGEALLLSGIDSTIMPMGDLMVQSVNSVARFVVFVVFVIVFGAFATIAEPDVSIFAGQATGVGVNISKSVLIFFIGAGVGLAVAIGILRIIKNIDIKFLYMFIFAIIFLLSTQVPNEYIAMAFDAGGATTGIISAPFLLAIASGISDKFSKKDKKDVFGMIGVASLGPIISTLLVFIFMKNNGAEASVTTENISIYLSILKQTTLSIIPLFFIFFVYDLLLIKLPVEKKLSMMIGLMKTFAGLFIFLFSIEFGISKMGYSIGEFIETLSDPLIIVFCGIIGFVVTFCEPSVIILARQVQAETKGNISSFVVILSIAISMAIAVLISVLKIIFNINFFYIILVGYAVALLLMFFVPSLFTGLAFDSGGAASGPMTSALLLPIMIQFASNSSSAISGFGIIGIVAISPIIVLQLLGFVYKLELHKKDIKQRRRAIKVAYTAEMYSNIQNLENEYKLLNRKNSQYER